MKNTTLSLFFACLLLLGGCVTGPEKADKSLVQLVNTEIETPEEQPSQPFTTDSLYQLLVADIALNRQQYQLALANYLQQARETKDIAIIELALRVAEHSRNNAASLELVELWVDNAPRSLSAHQAALQIKAMQGDAIGALNHAAWLFRQHDDIDAFLAVTSIQLSKTQTQELIEAYQTLPLSTEQKPFALLAIAMLYRTDGQLQMAEQSATAFLAIQPDNQAGLLLLARLMHQQDRVEEAATLLADALRKRPNDRPLRLQYARFLTLIDVQQAIVEFEALRSEDPADQEVNFLLALLLHNQGQNDRAMGLFAQASQRSSLRADAQFHMGTISETNGDTTNAIKHYAQVRFGRNYLPAVSRLTLLLNQQYGLSAARQNLQRLRAEQPEQAVTLFQIESNLLVSLEKSEEALSILSDGLKAFPNDTQLLYARSMVAEQQDDFVLAEKDLRTLIAMDENNAMALNALGYSMILHTDRHQEAQRLIKRAYLLNPGDPAIIDSMGWVLFKLGQLTEALDYLQKAFDLLPDPEIAAHLGEVQWLLGDRQTALDIWQQGLQQAPEHHSITEAMQRLGAEL
ncbi:MAG: tetratricopeptide repeat protein [Porticoccaceae bacterium]